MSTVHTTHSLARAPELDSSALRSPLRMLLEGLEGTILLVLAVATWPLARVFLTHWGTSAAERGRAWPGDRLVERVDVLVTRGISIRAPAAEVWPWLVQLGLDRGGFHSYELLERIGGITVRNVERILPHLQSLAVGETIVLYPDAPAVTVALLQPNEHLCFYTRSDERELAEGAPDVETSWSLYLVEAPAGDACRLLLRSCKQERRRPNWGVRLATTLLGDPLDFVMEQRMLRTIRRLAESPERNPVLIDQHVG